MIDGPAKDGSTEGYDLHRKKGRFLIPLADPIFDPSRARKGGRLKKIRASPYAHIKRKEGKEEKERKRRRRITTVIESSGVYHPTNCIQD